MVTFELLEIVDGYYRYAMYPEGDKDRMEIFEINPAERKLKYGDNNIADNNYIVKCLSNLNGPDGKPKSKGAVTWG